MRSIQYHPLQLEIICCPKSLWVEANAGSGKTLVLISRVLFLLAQGVAPKNILCITFSNNASQEILHRLQIELLKWAQDPNLTQTLAELLGYIPSAEIVVRMANIYQKLPEITISTIHGLCKQIVECFACNLGLMNNFKVLQSCKFDQIVDFMENSELLSLFVENMGDLYKVEFELNSMLQNPYCVKPLANFGDLLISMKILDQLPCNLHNLFVPMLSWDMITSIKFLGNYLKQCCHFNIDKLKGLLEKNFNLHLKKAIKDYINSPNIKNYQSIFFTKDQKPRNAFYHLLDDDPLKKEIFQEIDFLQNDLIFINQIYLSALYNEVCLIVFEAYKNYKQSNNLLDYNDMIDYVLYLFQEEKFNQDWVYDQLDYNFKYTLIDEAQDTNQKQWEVIKNITKSFCTNLMVVGDSKQSIYYFQGAECNIFQQKYQELKKYMQIEYFNLNLSFRAEQKLLDFVDEVCKQLGWLQVKHVSAKKLCAETNKNDCSSIEFLNLIKPTDSSISLESIMIEVICRKVANLLAAKSQVHTNSKLEDMNEKSEQTKIQPSDIVILLRRASGIDQKIANTLAKKYQISAYTNNNKLSQYLIVNDLLSLGKFFINPYDDLNLATILKGPLFKLTNQDLLEICSNSSCSLWQNLTNNYHDYANKLHKLLKLFKFYYQIKITPYYFFTRIWEFFNKDFVLDFGIKPAAILPFFDLCLYYGQNSSVNTLQDFLDNFDTLENSVPFHHQSNSVYITSIHQSKGLQYPIVILGDFFRINDITSRRNYLYVNHINMFLHKCYSKNSALFYHTNIELAESNRLLYVALTRAKNSLVIINIEDENGNNPYSIMMKNIIKNSCMPWLVHMDQLSIKSNWQSFETVIYLYSYLLGHLNTHLSSRINNDITSKLEYSSNNESIQNASKLDVDQHDNNAKLVSHIYPELDDNVKIGRVVPKPIFHTCPLNYMTPQILLGKIVHKVLEISCKNHLWLSIKSNISQDILSTLLSKLLIQYLGTQFEHHYHLILLQKVKNILDNPILKPYFDFQLKTEVGLSGWINNEFIICRVDCLHITNEVITILDFKTDKIVPSSTDEIPKEYMKQMSTYTKLLQIKYPKYQIQSMFIWAEKNTIIKL